MVSGVTHDENTLFSDLPQQRGMMYGHVQGWVSCQLMPSGSWSAAHSAHQLVLGHLLCCVCHRNLLWRIASVIAFVV